VLFEVNELETTALDDTTVKHTFLFTEGEGDGTPAQRVDEPRPYLQRVCGHGGSAEGRGAHRQHRHQARRRQ
jgi:hypothetical protein